MGESKGRKMNAGKPTPANEAAPAASGNDISKDAAKKQLLLRLSPSLWQNLAAWAEDDFRSINGQIEYLLSEAVKLRKKERNKISDKPEE